MNRKLLDYALGLLLITLTLAACTGGLTSKDPLWDREACAHCRMTISEHRFATQIMGPGATVRYYDDLGCALEDRRNKPELQKGRLYVRPYGSESWIRAEDAKYIEGLQTPMGYGYGPVAKDGRLQLAEIEAALRKSKP